MPPLSYLWYGVSKLMVFFWYYFGIILVQILLIAPTMTVIYKYSGNLVPNNTYLRYNIKCPHLYYCNLE